MGIFMKCISKQKYYKSCNKNYLILLPWCITSLVVRALIIPIQDDFGKFQSGKPRDLQVAKIALNWKSMAQTQQLIHHGTKIRYFLLRILFSFCFLKHIVNIFIIPALFSSNDSQLKLGWPVIIQVLRYTLITHTQEMYQAGHCKCYAVLQCCLCPKCLNQCSFCFLGLRTLDLVMAKESPVNLKNLYWKRGSTSGMT